MPSAILDVLQVMIRVAYKNKKETSLYVEVSFLFLCESFSIPFPVNASSDKTKNLHNLLLVQLRYNHFHFHL